jgi:hypothetical protein
MAVSSRREQVREQRIREHLAVMLGHKRDLTTCRTQMPQQR